MAQDPDQVRLQGRGERPWVPWRRRRGATTLPSPAASSECLEIPYRKEAGRKEMPVTLSDLLFFFFFCFKKDRCPKMLAPSTPARCLQVFFKCKPRSQVPWDGMDSQASVWWSRKGPACATLHAFPVCRVPLWYQVSSG